ncbi:hypothetical protein OS493_020466 [Desmophyllum pertusum]|uniref:DNA-directed DNA polymerase n=1 Tax=Desmophyllum pertusum TaxID=174260 RepID=A0A9W9ZEU9_9CNID|nr:hypothetical protein OS493_020466 [Desmophyllum pertusum]
MDFPDFTKQGVVQASGVEFPRSSLHTPTSSSRWKGHEPRAWKEVLEDPRECKNTILLSEPGQRVVRAIREICGARQGMTSQCTQQQASEYYLQESQTAPRRQLCFTEDHKPNQERNDSQKLSSAPPCGIQQRLQANAVTPRNVSSHPSEEEESPYFAKTGESSNKRKAQSPITNYFKERKAVSQVNEVKKAKPTNADAPQKEHVDKNQNGVSSMNSSQREAFEQNLKSAEEVACTVVYEDGWSLLRPKKQKTKKQTEDVANKKVARLVVALPWSEMTSNTTDSAQRRKNRLMFVEIPLDTADDTLGTWCRQVIDDLMTSTSTRKICFGAQKMVRYLMETTHYDIRKVCLNWRLLDPKIAAWLLNPDHPPQTFADVLTSVQLHFPECGEMDDTMICQDVAMLGPLMLKQHSKLKTLSLWDLFINIETPLCSMLAVMETQGIGINSQVLIEASNTLKMKIQKVEAEAHKAAGHPFLINSPQQLREVLFEELRLDQKCKKKLARTSIKNHKSTSEAVLLHLQEFHPLPKLVLQYRHLVKLKSTYFDGILSHVNGGVLLTSWDQTAAATGRLTSANPNLQAIPKQVIEVSGIKKQLIVGKPEEVVTIYARDAYRSREGWLLLAADFQSIELRLLSHLSEDPSLIHIFNDKQCADVFTTLASQWLGKSCDEVQFHERERTKRIVYSVNLRCCIESCHRNGYVSSILNRRRWLPHIKSYDFTQRSQAERQAVNFIVQGSAADICKAAMIQVISTISEDTSIHARLLLQIHDELLLEVPENEIMKVTATVKSIMESTEKLCGGKVKLKVPLPVSISIGQTWGHMETCTA